ncbi:4'-phosphopantetheinyl transferase family protein [Natronospora cellulosivora (SeqCode)]
MIKIYGINISEELDNKIYNIFLNLISPEKQNRIKRFRFFQDAQRCLLGDILVRYAICKNLDIDNDLLKFSSNEYGKPFLLKPKDFYFNISHSGDWVVCAVGNKPLGVDVELIKTIDYNIAKRFFSKDEFNDLLKIDKEKRLEYFYKLWTLKESYIKAEGKGLSIPLNTFSFKIKKDDIKIFSQKELKPYFFWQHKLYENYILSLCSLKKLDKECIEIVSLSQLLNYMV